MPNERVMPLDPNFRRIEESPDRSSPNPKSEPIHTPEDDLIDPHPGIGGILSDPKGEADRRGG